MYPNFQQIIQEEVDKTIVMSGSIDWDSVKKLDFTEMFIKEGINISDIACCNNFH